MLIKLILIILISISTSALAFEPDLSINYPNFNKENFLDINKAQYDENLNEQWYHTENGWRISSHSLTTDLLYLNSEIKLVNELSDRVAVRVNYQQEIFYTEKDIEAPQLELEIKPSDKYPITTSLIGTTDYNKTKSELGLAFTVGKRTASYFRLSDLVVDYYFNEKTNSPSSYLKQQHITSINSAYYWSENIYLRFDYSYYSPMDFLYDDLLTHFKHKGYEYDGFIKYKTNTNNSYKLSIKGFEFNKSITGTTNQGQDLSYHSVDIKWLARQQHTHPMTFGYRDDDFSNDIFSTTTFASVLDYPFSSRQIYSTIEHQYAANKSWKLGLYIGMTKEPNDFNNPDSDKRVYEGKFDITWAYHAKNKKSAVYVHFALNLDDLENDPGDGGGVTYQSTF